MCTLTLVRNASEIILTHNRDENVKRPGPLEPKWHLHGNLDLWYPKDQKGGGTWMACSKNAFVCLLNGGFEKHVWDGPYKHSRGLVPLELLQHSTASDFIKHYDFAGIEPFTMVHVDATQRIHSIIWDGIKPHLKEIKSSNAIWSSSTLYNSEIRKNRAEVFSTFLKSKMHPNSEDMLQFHNIAEVGNAENNLVMKRENGIQTLSIFQFVIGLKGFKAHYINLQTGNEYTETQ